MKKQPTPQSTTPLLPLGTRVRIKQHLLWKSHEGKIVEQLDGKNIIYLDRGFTTAATTEQLEVL